MFNQMLFSVRLNEPLSLNGLLAGVPRIKLSISLGRTNQQCHRSLVRHSQYNKNIIYNTRKLDDGKRIAAAIKKVQGKRLKYRESVDNPPYLAQAMGQLDAPLGE